METGDNTGKKDTSGKEICVGHHVRFDENLYTVKYGNFIYLGVERVGCYIEAINPSTETQIKPLTNNSVTII